MPHPNPNGQVDTTGQTPIQHRPRHIWALAVAIVVCGQYFGWNLGLKDNGPIALLIASLLVCLLFTGWVLMLSELAVAMPTAGGPMEYGTRASGPWLGFLMGWSMFLECLFGGVATALASGGYIAYLLNPVAPDVHITVIAGLATILIFFIVQTRREREQAQVLTWMIYGALFALVVFWIAAGSQFSWENLWHSPVLPEAKGWRAVIDAVPYSLWWLIIIEGAVLTAGQTWQPHRTVPRGLTWAMLTVTVMVALTIVTACGALSARAITGDGGDYPLAIVMNEVAKETKWLLYGFGAMAVFGLLASYHGLLYSASRQLSALGREGFIPPTLGRIHPRRQTPIRSLTACSIIAAGFVLSNLAFPGRIMTLAILVAGFAALVLYVLSMICLLILRRRNSEMFHAYRAPLSWGLPAAVMVLSLLALCAYPRIDTDGVLPLALGLFAAGIMAFSTRSRQREGQVGVADPTPSQEHAVVFASSGMMGRITGASLVVVLAGAAWLALVAMKLAPCGWFVSSFHVGASLIAVSVALLLLSMLALRRLR